MAILLYSILYNYIFNILIRPNTNTTLRTSGLPLREHEIPPQITAFIVVFDAAVDSSRITRLIWFANPCTRGYTQLKKAGIFHCASNGRPGRKFFVSANADNYNAVVTKIVTKIANLSDLVYNAWLSFDLKVARISLDIRFVLTESSMEIFLDLVRLSVTDMNFDTLTRVNYSRQSQLYDATVGVTI